MKDDRSFFAMMATTVAAWILGLVLISSMGCAHTPYEVCDKNNEYQRYGSMDECISEVREDQSRRKDRMSHAFDNMGKQRSTTCSPNGFGGYNCN